MAGWGRDAFRTAALALAIGLGGCGQPNVGDRDVPATDAQRLARTVAIIRAATDAQPTVLRVLFYGQSITSPRWTDPVVRHWRRTYPNVRFVARNLAIGGFAADALKHTAERDLDDAQPDLIVFHVYGGEADYEHIIRLIRSRTAAEVIVQTDHPTLPREPVCPVGLRTSLTLPAGCAGSVWLRQNDWSERMSSVLVPAIADRYGLAVEPRRRRWQAYLDRHRLPAQAMLADDVHPNDRGWRLMAGTFARWFDEQVATLPPAAQQLVIDLPPPRPGQSRSYEVSGNRIELIADAPLAGHVAVTVDGRAPGAIDGCWLASRTTSLPNVPDWPAVRKVALARERHVAERWTATINAVDREKGIFGFAVESDRAGNLGRGEAGKDFVSRDGDVRIAADDWMVQRSYALNSKPVPNGTRISWNRSFVCGDDPNIVTLTRDRRVSRHVAASGLANEPHRLRVRVSPGAPRIAAIRIYRPPLVES